MQRMMEETERRREIQLRYNEEHGIIPQTIIKSISEIELSTRVADAKTPREAAARVAEKRRAYGGAESDGRSAEEVIAQLEKEMRDAAAQLDFERAAMLRDQLLELKAESGGKAGRRG